MNRCAAPIELDVLVAYQTGQLDEATATAVEEHYFGCASCAARLSWLQSLSDAVRSGVTSGAISAAVSSSWVAKAEEQGVLVRTYALSPGGSVACTASPKDDFVVVRLRVGEAIGSRADVETTFTDLTTGEGKQQVLEDVAVDVESGEVVYVFSGAQVRSFPKSRWTIHVRPHGDQHQSLGPYTMNHTPWDALPSST